MESIKWAKQEKKTKKKITKVPSTCTMAWEVNKQMQSFFLKGRIENSAHKFCTQDPTRVTQLG